MIAGMSGRDMSAAAGEQERFLGRIAPGTPFYRMFDLMPDLAFFVKDADFRIMGASRPFFERFGFHEELEILGRNDFDLFPPRLAENFRGDDEEVLRTGLPKLQIMELFFTPQGIPDWFVTNKLPLRDAKERIIGTTGTTRRLKDDARGIVGAHGFEAVLLRIRDGYRSSLPNRDLAALAGLSVRAFERRFLQSFHVTPQLYIRRLRIRMACRALVFTDKPIADVAIGCGFADQSHFGHEFRRHTGRTPRSYREHYKTKR